MTPLEELGILVNKLQDDEIRTSELVRFYTSVVHNKEVREKLRLVGKTIDIPPERAQNFFESGLRYVFGCVPPPNGDARALLSSTPSRPIEREARLASLLGGAAKTGPWTGHFRAKIFPAPKGRKKPTIPKAEVYLSEEAKDMIVSLQHLWNPPEPFVK